MVNLSEIADKIDMWANRKGKGDIYEARFVADRDDRSIMQVKFWVFDSTSKDTDLRKLEKIMLAYGHWAKHLYNLGKDPSAFALNQTILEYAKAIDESPKSKGYFSTQVTRAKRSRISPGLKWRTTLKRKGNGELYVHTTAPGQGNPRIMAPASVLTLFDKLMDSLGDVWRPLFLAGLGAMHNYYTTQGHTQIQQTNEGPLRGLQAILATISGLAEERADRTSAKSGPKPWPEPPPNVLDEHIPWGEPLVVERASAAFTLIRAAWIVCTATKMDQAPFEARVQNLERVRDTAGYIASNIGIEPEHRDYFVALVSRFASITLLSTHIERVVNYMHDSGSGQE